MNTALKFPASFQLIIDKNLSVVSCSELASSDQFRNHSLDSFLQDNFKVSPNIIDCFIRPFIKSGSRQSSQVFFLKNPQVYSLTIGRLMFKEGYLWSLTLVNERPLVPLSNELWHKSIHDLKSPLTTMKIFADILKRKLTATGSSELVSHAQKILNKTDELTSLINYFSQAYEIDEMKHLVSSTVCDSKELLEVSLNQVQETFSGLTISSLNSDSVSINFDQSRFKDVIFSAVKAIEKYSPDCRQVIVKSRALPGYLDISIVPKPLAKILTMTNPSKKMSSLAVKIKTDFDIYCLLACQTVRLFKGDYVIYKTKKGIICNITIPQA